MQHSEKNETLVKAFFIIFILCRDNKWLKFSMFVITLESETRIANILPLQG